MGVIKSAIKMLQEKSALVGVPAIIRNSKGEILLGKRSKFMPTFPGLWGLPGGLVEYDEKLETAMKREIKEELGVSCEIEKVAKRVYEDLPDKRSRMHTVDIPHYCKIKGKPKAKDETSKIGWFKHSEIKKMNLAYNHKKILKGEGLI